MDDKLKPKEAQSVYDRLDALEKNSHPPIDFLERIAEAINSGEMTLYINVSTGKVSRVTLGD